MKKLLTLCAAMLFGIGVWADDVFVTLRNVDFTAMTKKTDLQMERILYPM